RSVIIASSASGICSGDDKTFFVQYDAAIQPAGVRVRANKQEEVTQGTGVGSPSCALSKHRRSEARDLVPFQRDYLGFRVQLHIGQRGDTVDEIARHRGF